VKAGPRFELLGKHQLGETTLATAAISENILYYRTRSPVLAIGAVGGQH